MQKATRKYKVLTDKEIGGKRRRKGEIVDLHPRQAKYLLGTWLEEMKPAAGETKPAASETKPEPAKKSGKAAKKVGGDSNA